ncbi:transporter [Hyphomicrobium sp. CS1GBMeth3]|uniref:transporter n=1 Tax=Hyphomicrobium sp. CS1GBMeth3 TaxID=1892845 RepID=UPI000AA94971|nr:transporter [Hyphomicrobium sp. CS1GBMeth3]
MKFVRLAVVSGAVLGLATSAAGAGDKERYTLWNPTPDALLRDMSTDRPDKTESPYTVDAGRIQIETDLVGYTYDSRDGVTTRALDVLPFNLKVGLTNSTDLQVAYGAYGRVRTSGGGVTDRETGFGDLTVRVKHNVWGNDGGQTAFAIMPFVKLPTNTFSDLNDDVEGGIIVPLAIDLGSGVGLGLMTEVDILRAGEGRGYEPTFINSAALGFDLTEKWGAYVEAFVERSAESGAETIVTLSGGFTYAVNNNLQLDAGANVGVTEAADDLNVFVGLSRRY